MVTGGGALFGGGRTQQQSKYLVEFRAGKMTMNSDKLVTPDKRKGLVIVHQADDQLMHFMWKDRGTGNVEDDLIIFPDDVEFKRVTQCTTGRVFLLKFKSSNRRMFFWMQEPKTDKDEEYCKKVNEYLNHPPAPGSAGRAGGSGGLGALGALGGGLDLGNLGDAELQSLLNNMNQQQLMQLFGGGLSGGGLASLLGGGQGPSSGRQRASARMRDPALAATTTTTTTAASASAAATTTTTTASSTPPTTTSSAAPASGSAASPAAPPIQLSDLQNILSGIKVPSGAEGGAAAAAKDGPAVDLAAGLTGEMVEPLLKNPDFMKRMKELLPQEHQNNDVETEVKGTIQSPQFQQALSLFSSAFQSGQLAPLIREFDLGEEAITAATAGDLDAFTRALQKKEEAKKEKKKDDEPEDMALD